MKIKTFKKGIEYRINLSLSYLTLEGLLESTSQISSYLKDIPISEPGSSYLSANLITNILEVIPGIKETFESCPTKRLQVTKQIAYIVGDISSLFLAYGYNGAEFYLTLGLNLLKNRGTTFIINKLENLRQIDGVSCSIILGTLFSIPKLIKSFSNSSLFITILNISSLVALFGINYKILKTKETIPIIFTNGKEEKIEISVNNSYVTSILLCSVLEKIFGLYSPFAITLFIPIITFILSNDLYSFSDKITEYLQKSEGIIPGRRPGNDTKKYLDNIIKNSNIAYSIIGCLVFILSYQLISLFNLMISPLYLSLIINSLLNINNNIKSIKSIKNIKGFLKEK